MKLGEEEGRAPFSWALAWVFAALFFIGGIAAGHKLVPEVLDWWDEQFEWGTEPDYRKPWDPGSCADLAGTIRLGEFARSLGVRKRAFMERLQDAFDGQDASTAEALGEISGAWDRGETAKHFFARCLKAYGDKLRDNDGTKGASS